MKTDQIQKVHKDWYKLDLSAIVYPTLQRRDFSSVYRLSVLLKEDIDPEILQRAVNLTMPRFPTYKAAIRKGVLDILGIPDPGELEDAYMKYANAKVCPPRPGEKTYRVRGTKEPFYTLNIIDGIMSVSEVMRVAKSYNATITEYLNSVLLYALMRKQESEWHLKLRPVKIAMPVNLRRFFPSRTLRNFITMIYPGIDPRLGEYTFEEIVTQVHNYMRYYLNEKLLRGDITTNAETQRNPFIRIVPLFIKDLVVRQFYTKIQDKNSSAGLTNMGALKVPETMKPYIERFDIYMGQPFSTRTNCAIASFEDILTINFASSIAETDVERLFFRKLVQDGIHVKIESNR